jgi:drug/metabolite transporter (DMT)-like permease
VSLVVLFTTFFWSYGIATTKSCTSSIPEIIHHQSLIGMYGSAIAYLFLEKPVPTEGFLWSFLYVGTIQALAIVMFNFAIYIAENTNLTSIMVQNVILVSYVIGIFRYHEPVDYIGLFGGVLLIIGVTIVILSKK